MGAQVTPLFLTTTLSHHLQDPAPAQGCRAGGPREGLPGSPRSPLRPGRPGRPGIPALPCVPSGARHTSSVTEEAREMASTLITSQPQGASMVPLWIAHKVCLLNASQSGGARTGREGGARFMVKGGL